MKILRSIAIALLAILTLSVVVFFAYRPMEETSHHYGHGDSTYLHLCTSTAEVSVLLPFKFDDSKTQD